MIERGGGLGFALEARESLRVCGERFRQKFERHEAAQADVFGLVDHAHAATAEAIEDTVMGERLANQRRRIIH